LYDARFYVAFACHEPRFPAADICNQFRATRDGDSLHFDFMPGPDDNWSGNTLFEWIPGDLWLEMGGMASGRVETTTVAAAGTIYVTARRAAYAAHQAQPSRAAVPQQHNSSSSGDERSVAPSDRPSHIV
jgi:hypothetical protein